MDDSSTGSILDRLNEYLHAEHESEQLEKIPQSTYTDVAIHMRKIRENTNQGKNNIISLLKSKEEDLLYRLTKRLLEIRIKKVLENYQKNINDAHLTSEETYILEPINQHQKRLDKVERSLANGQTALLEIISENTSSKYTVIRVLNKMPSTIGADLGRYGPFEAEDITVMPIDNASLLFKQGLAQEVELDFD